MDFTYDIKYEFLINLIDNLTKTKLRTETFYNLSANDLQKSYAAGKWNIRKILVHLADAESVLHERLKRIISEPDKVVWAFDQDAWCEKLNYASFPLDVSKAIFSANRQSIIYLADRYYRELGHIEFVHSEAGIRTLKQEFDKVIDHNAAHLRQIEIALLLMK